VLAVDDDPSLCCEALGCGFRRPRDEHRTRRVGCGRGRDELLDEDLHACLEGARFVERARIDDDERLAQVCRALVGREQRHGVGAERGAAKDAREHVHDQGQAVALVATGRFHTAERMQRTGERGLGRRGWVAVRIDGPADRQRPAAPRRDLDPATRHGGGGHVQAEGIEPPGRRRDGDGVGAQHRDATAGGCDQR
jgi:hypothetical protein